MPEKNNFLILIFIILALEAILFSFGNNKLDLAFLNSENRLAEIQNLLANTPVEAKAFSVYDFTLSRKIYGKNDETEMPIASLAKIMTVATALNGKDEEDIVSISADAVNQLGDYGFFVHEKFKIKDLAKFILIGSANDGVYALAENSGNPENFLEKMNEKARKIGMKNSPFFNFTGLDIDDVFAGAYASAEDVNLMSFYAFKAYPEIFGASVLPEIKIKSESDFEHNIKNTNLILEKIPNILFSKTGLTPLAGGNLTVIFQNKNKHIIAITVLGSTSEGRFADMEKIVHILYDFGF